jgi:CHAT domain-containing protein
MKRVFATATFCVALLGCQQDGQRPVVSLDQARQITANFQGQGFQPPPRTISDIAAVLDQQKPDPAKVAALAAQADAQPPSGANDFAMAEFLLTRGMAAGELGRNAQRLADLREASRLAIASGASAQRISAIQQQQSFAEIFGGSPRAALDIARQRVAASPNIGQRMSAQMTVVAWAPMTGALDESRAMLPRMESTLADAVNNPRTPQFVVLNGQTMLARARSRFAMEEGKFAEAERQTRLAMDYNQRLIAQEAGIVAQGGAAPGVFTSLQQNLVVDLAVALLRQGKLMEAEVEIRRALLQRLERFGRYSAETLATLATFADILLEQGRAAEAERLGRVALESFDTMKFDPASPGPVRALRVVARAQSQREDWQGAARSYAEIRRRAADQPDLMRATFDASPNWAMVALRNGDAGEARRVLTSIAADRTAVLGPRHWDTGIARGMLGAAILAQGDANAALAEFDAALPVLLQSSRQADDEETGSAARDAQVKMIFEAAMGALARSGRTGAAEESFRLADAVRGAGVQRALAQSSARAAAADPALADFVRREQDTQKQIGALQGLLTNVLAGAERDENAVRALRTQIDTLRGARAALRQEIERRFPSYAQLIDPRPATIDDARKALRANEALIATYVGRTQSFVWAVPASGAPAFAAVSKGRARIAEAVANLRKSLDPNAATLGDIPAFDVALASSLYDDLLKPVEAGFANANSLLVVPHDALGQLPFGVLVTQRGELAPERASDALFANYRQVPFLIRKAAITQLPSVASLATLRGLPVPPANRKAFVGFGDPWFNPEQAAEAKAEQSTQTAQLVTRGLQTRGLKLVRRNAPATQGVDSAELGLLPRLPDTADEVRGIALALNADAADVILGAAANEKTVKGMDLSDRRVVMFATHGLIPGDLNGLTQPALALSAPSVADADGDGLLTLDEVLALRLNADWVVLSACNTATGDGAGAEAVSGLGRAFFYAGTRALLVSNWPVETTSARALTTDLFARQARNPDLARAEALRQAMAGLIDGPGLVDPASNATVFAYSHPIFWAPFTLVGDGGGAARQQAALR